MEKTQQQDFLPGRGASTLGLLLGVFTLAAGVLGYLLYLNWYSVGYPVVEPIREQIAQRVRAYQFARRLAMDPAVGARLRDLPSGEGAAPGAGAAGGAIAVVFAGSLDYCPCSGLDDLAARLNRTARDAPGRRGRAAFVFHARPGAVRGFVAQRRLACEGVADPDGALATAYNAFWMPRAYVVSDGRLVWIQKTDRLDEAAIDRAFRQAVAQGGSPLPRASATASR
jgi:hypothetical protein